ncbi:nitroreductase/quinone reductase family protein [Microlunatus sp. Gsoil 973]|uniref:nitroreductase/quinone reductase family protein n=1 Tax=Microlunatus sp. Gsoil 973 TaxID=2672569 RepID=UPI0018A84796|nr:nitroreductase/quinone reductase family protein [Microlunatus sp. Gsoil 973]
MTVRRRIVVWINRVLNLVVRGLRLRRFRGADLLLLTTTGRNTGQPRTTPLLYMRDHDRWIVAASNAGADWQPGWWLNLRAGYEGVVEVGGRRTPVVGIEVSGPERDRLWHQLNERVFDYESYQARVQRRIAVVALEPQTSRSPT